MDRYQSDLEWYDEGNFIVRAMSLFGKKENEAIVDWRNQHYAGKYVICESRPGFDDGRMFIRTLTNLSRDAMSKKGWWNTFTISERTVANGLWLCEVKRYKLDRNGYINLIVEPLTPVPELKFKFFLESSNGTWNSSAIKLMLGCGNFLPEYQFSTFTDLNVQELKSRFPQYSMPDYMQMCNRVLGDWLEGTVSLEELENALNEKTPYEKFIKRISKSVAQGTVSKEFSDYPVLCEKLGNQDSFESSYFRGYIDSDKIKNYIERNLDAYKELVKEGKISPVEEEDMLLRVETVLAYRKAQKELEKAARKAARKAKKQQH